MPALIFYGVEMWLLPGQKYTAFYTRSKSRASSPVLWQDAESQPGKRIELPFLKSEESYLKMMDQINAY